MKIPNFKNYIFYNGGYEALDRTTMKAILNARLETWTGESRRWGLTFDYVDQDSASSG